MKKFGKQITFMKLNRSINDAGEQFISCTVANPVMHATELVEMKDPSRSVISFIIPIQNRSRTIAHYCGAEPSTDETGTTWADVTAWGHCAQNFAKYIQRHPRGVITIVGSMRMEEVKDKQGVPYNRIKITMTSFDHKADMPDVPSSSDASDQPSLAADTSDDTAANIIDIASVTGTPESNPEGPPMDVA